MSVTVLRPNSDANTTWTITGAASRQAATSDNTDTTWIGNPGTGSYQGVGMTTVSLSASQRVKSVTFRMRYRFVGAGYVELRFISFGLIQSRGAITQQSSAATTGGTVSSAAFTTDAGYGEWGQGDLDTLELRVYEKASVSGRIAVYELYADVDVNNRPTVATPTVTGNTTSSRPAAAWVYSDTEGDPQTAYEVKVFSAAQYGIAGFDPSSSPSTYASGTRLGDAATFTIPKDLVNAVTYKVYVRAAQDFNGARWFSDWSASAAFTMAYEPIPAPTLTVTSDATLPSYRNKITVDTKLNLLSSDDASFEAGQGTWGQGANTTALVSAAQAFKGAQSLRLTNSSGITNTVFANTAGGTNGYPARAGQSYTVLLHTRAAITARQFRARIVFSDGAGADITDALGSLVTNTSSGWTQALVTATAPAGTKSCVIEVQVLATVNGEQHYLDAISLSTSSSTTWYAGGASQVDYQFIEYTDLTPQNAPVVNLFNPQLASGGELQAATDGFNTRSVKDLVVFDRDLAWQGEGSIRWDVGNNTGSLLDIGTALGVYDTTYTAPAVPGTAYTFSAYVRAGSGTRSLRLVATSIDGAGAVVGTATNGSTNATIAQAWQRISVTHTAQTGAVGLRLSLDNTANALASYYLDGLQLEEGSSATVWHQGQGQVPAWQPVRGAASALTSDQRTGIAVCYDREAPPGVIRLYRATNIAAYASGTTGASPVSNYIPAKLPILDTTFILKDPQQPAHDLAVRVESLAEQISEDLTEFHPVRPNAIQGFGQRPVFSSDWIGGVGGTVTVGVTDDHDWYKLLQLLESKRTLLLQLPEGGQRYVRFTGDRSWARTRIAGDGNATRPSRYLRVASLPFSEVDRPAVLA